MAILFDNSDLNGDSEFHVWRRDHGNGFVLTTHENRRPGNMRLHRAGCRHMLRPGVALKENPLTQGYNKVCSDSVEDLRNWARENVAEFPTDLRPCNHCRPPQPPGDGSDPARTFEGVTDAFAAAVRKVEADSIEMCLQRLKTAPRRPDKVTVTTIAYIRNPDVVRIVLDRAKGICASCHREGPFARVDGTRFLEVHHKKPLAKGGEDTVANAEALCPNCHREKHFGIGSSAEEQPNR